MNMPMTKQPYSFLPSDTARIVALKYQFIGIDEKDFERFIVTNYPDFDVAGLLEVVESVMARLTGLQITRSVEVYGDTLHLKLFNEHNGDEKIAVIFDRIFKKESNRIYVKHAFLVIPEKYQAQKLAQKILQPSLQQYINMGVYKIHVTAGLSAGPYVWAHHGFVAVEKTEMQHIIDRAETMISKEQLDGIKEIFDEYYKINGDGARAFPISRWVEFPFMKKVLMSPEAQWDGELDLTNQEQLRKFESYVSRV